MAAQEQSKVCPKCFEVNDGAATYCIECGAPLSDDPASDGSDREVYREITQANLLRIRGDYKGAIDVCLGILKRFPNNGTAHTLLGDIYAEKGELEQASQWFEMALDLRPESENDRRKFESVQKRMAEQEAANTAKQLGIPESKPKTQQYVVVMVVLVAIVGIGAFLFGKSLNANAASRPPEVINTPIDVGGPKNEPQQAQPDDQPKVDQPDIGATAFPGFASEQAIASLISTKYTVGRKLVGVREDPRGPSLTIVSRSDQGDDPAQIAVDFAKAVFVEYPNIVSITVQITDGASLTYIADANRADYQKAVDENLDGAAMLTKVWPVEPAGQ